jgi:hypothetical protein
MPEVSEARAKSCGSGSPPVTARDPVRSMVEADLPQLRNAGADSPAMTESRFRIFAAAIPYGVGPPRPMQAPPPPDRQAAPIVERDRVLDEMSRILDGQPEIGESVQRSFDRKERELRAFFDQLDHDGRAAAYLRLANGQSDDPFVAKLARLSAERRQRIIASLGEAPRRRMK